MDWRSVGATEEERHTPVGARGAQNGCDDCKGLGPTHVPMSPRARTAV